jgi:hypothetical protein
MSTPDPRIPDGGQAPARRPLWRRRWARIAVLTLVVLIGLEIINGIAHAGQHPAPAQPAPSHSALASPAAPAASTPPASTPPPAAPAAPANTLSCSTVVDDTGYKNGPLTAERTIAFLNTVLTTDAVNLSSGNASNDDLRLLDEMATELQNYSGTKLADDASQFVSDEQSYNPGQTDFGPEDTSYATAMEGGILTLDKDCPGAVSMAQQMLHGS